MIVNSWSATDTGRVREHNEDALFTDDQRHVFLVADGVGGAAAGELASGSVVNSVAQAAHELYGLVDAGATKDGPSRRAVFDRLHRLLDDANAQIYRTAQENPQLKGMATTASLLLLSNAGAFVAHVGDSRIYLIRDGKLHRITEDHTWAQELVKQGDLRPEDVPNFRYRNVIVRSVGGAAKVRPDFLFIDTEPGDEFLLCSDGLTDYTTEDEMLAILRDFGAAGAPARLVEAANRGGGGDNITVVTVRLQADGSYSMVEEPATRPLLHTHKQALLRNLVFFQHLTEEEMLKVLRYVYEEDYAPQQTVFQQGEDGKDIFFVAHGVVDVLVDNVRVTSVGVGGHFGELSLVMGDARSATVRARERTKLLRMSQEDFYDLSQKDQAVAIKILWSFLQTLGHRVKTLSSQVAGQR